MVNSNRKKRKKALTIGIVIVVVVALVVVAWPIIMPNTADTYNEEAVKKQDIETYYTFSGSVQSESSQNVMASTVLQINEIRVEEGEQVEKDDVLFVTSAGQRIKSQIDGTVSKIYVKIDEQVVAGTLLCDVIDFEHLQLSVKVSEYDISSISQDEEVAVYISALDTEITGTIDSVSATAVHQNGVSFFTAVIHLPSGNDVKVGMSAEAKILNKQANDVLTISMKALQFDDDGNTYVLLKQEKGAPVKQSIQVGINDGKSVEVKEGLTEGEIICYIPVSESDTSMGFMGRNA